MIFTDTGGYLQTLVVIYRTQVATEHKWLFTEYQWILTEHKWIFGYLHNTRGYLDIYRTPVDIFKRIFRHCTRVSEAEFLASEG